METKVKSWVRLGIAVAMGGPQLLIGLWALLAPKNWFETFPGFDPRVVAAEPPYNEHLSRDVGAGFLATGVVLVVAALWANRAAIHIALLAFVAFTVPHVLYHATNPARALTGVENAVNTLSLASGLVLAVVFGWHLRSTPDRATTATELTHR